MEKISNYRTNLLSTKVAAAQKEQTDREIIGLFYLSDNELSKFFSEKDPEGGFALLSSLFKRFAAMRPVLIKQWEEAGFISLSE